MTHLLKYRYLNEVKILSEQQHNVLTALMLGDGHLRKQKNNARLKVRRAQVDVEYLKCQYNIFKEFCTDNGFFTRTDIDPRSKNEINYSVFYTLSIPIFTEYHNKWYRLNPETNRYIKIVPTDLQLNSEIIANWICDDGYIQNSGDSHHRFIINIATQSFTKDEVYFLAELLSKRYNEYFRPEDHREGQFIIRSSSDTAARALITDIDKVFPVEMKRKRLWDHPEARFYSNQPKETTALHIFVEDKNKRIAEYCSTNFCFTATQLSKHLDWTSMSHGKLKTTRVLLNYLDKLISKNYITKILVQEGNIRQYYYTVSEFGKAYFLTASQNAKEILYCNR
jgi:LAGLIDADG DNA endonuclease family